MMMNLEYIALFVKILFIERLYKNHLKSKSLTNNIRKRDHFE